MPACTPLAQDNKLSADFKNPPPAAWPRGWRVIKYFSGTATYTKTIDVKKEWLKDKSVVWLDLGTVGDIAVVTVNGSKPDTLWKAPYITSLGGQLKPGKNTIEIKVTNEWSNRITGDLLLPADKKFLSPARRHLARQGLP